MGKTKGKEESKNGSLESVLLYLFLLFLAYMVSDLLLLRYVRPLFLSKATKKDAKGLNLSFEPESGSFEVSEVGSMGSYTDLVVKRNIFNSGDMPPPLASIAKEGTQDAFEEDADPVLTSLPLELKGTAVHRNPFRSLATVGISGKSLSFAVGDQINNMAEVISVLRKKVIFRNLRSRRLEYVQISDKFVKARKLEPQGPSLPPPSGLKKVGSIKRQGNRFTAKRSDVNRYLSDYSSLLRQANSRLAKDPATGDIRGFEIFAIKPGSLFEQLGIENGDVITSVNGAPVKSAAQAMGLFTRLRNASEVNVTVDRGGSDMDLEYSIED